MALLHNTILPNFGTMIRWRAHRHVLRQPVGWFESDFAGRIANRIMQAPPAAGEAVFQVFDMAAFAAATFIGALLMLADADPRLMIPLLIWFVALRRPGALDDPPRRACRPRPRPTRARRSRAGWWTAYTNIHSVKLFAHHDSELNYAKEAIENARQTFQKEMRIVTKMDVALTFLNGLPDRWRRRLGACCSGYQGAATVGIVAAATALVLRLNTMTYWIMWASTSLVQNLGVVPKGWRRSPSPSRWSTSRARKPLSCPQGLIEIAGLSPPLRARLGRAAERQR